MDKNQVTGLVLISALLLAYGYFFAPSEEDLAKQQAAEAVKVEQTTTQPSQPAETPALPDSVQALINQQKFGNLAEATTGTATNATLENEDIKVIFSSKGASIASVELKKYKTYDQKPLILLDEESSQLNRTIQFEGRNVNLSELYFSTPQLNGNTITFNLPVGNGSIQQSYTLAEEGYTLNADTKLNNLGSSLNSQTIAFDWTNRLKRVEPDLDSRAGARMNTTAHYYTAGGDFEELSMSSSDKEIASPAEQISWIAFKQKFFTSSVIPSTAVKVSEVSIETPANDSTTVKIGRATFDYNADQSIEFFFGPNQYDILKEVAPGFDQNLNLGWFIFKYVNKYIIINIFHFFEKFTSNYGLIILMLVLVIKMLLFPMTYKSYLSMAKMRVLQPELAEIKEQHPDDMQKQQSAQMELYSKAGVNPLSGCIPMLLQMPILFAMFRFFPNSVELRQESFLWAHDLSTFDSILDLPFSIPFYGDHVSLFTLLMTVSTILYTKATNQNTNLEGPMKSIQYMMPIMMIFFLNDFPAGLTYYYFLSNIITFGQTYAIRKFVDDDAIHAKLQEAKKNAGNRKKTGFQARLQEAMKQSQEMQKQRTADQNKKKK
ncbi:membrane protein insertase YidC [Persicobacter diffluens]|uniref:Membrane protein insertase YidC n=1 Tax=Persicobacter diffluens TaxID=981 RepID=A0AAN4VW67_9BACT|nr:membrane protein insertase YidC [Persicobacter diffluens]